MFDKKSNKNMDFSGIGHKKDEFSKKYMSIFHEFSPSEKKNIDKNNIKERMRIISMQNKLDNKSNSINPNFTSKLSNIKYDYLTQDTIKKKNTNTNNTHAMGYVNSLGNFDSGCKFYF